MGRKNKIMKEKKNIEVESDEDFENNTDLEEEEKNIEEQKLSIIYNIRQELIQYCDDVSVPLCEYLSLENIIDYIESLSC